MSDPGDVCGRGECDAECVDCSALAEIIDSFNEGYCRPHWDDKQDRESERADAAHQARYYGGLNPYLYHGEDHEAARDHYWEQRISEAREK